MARMSNDVADTKKRQAQELYIKGLSVQSISEIIEVSVASLNKWKNENEWDEAKKIQNISISELQNMVLETFDQMRNGEAPKIKPDEISKLASAFEKLSNKQKQLPYLYDSFELLTTLLSENVVIAKSKDKAFKLACLKYVRAAMQEVTNDVYAKAFD